MDFTWALAALKDGRLVGRRSWGGEFLYLVPGSEFTVNRHPLLGIYADGTRVRYQPHIDKKTADGTCTAWNATHADLLADDWEFVEAS